MFARNVGRADSPRLRRGFKNAKYDDHKCCQLNKLQSRGLPGCSNGQRVFRSYTIMNRKQLQKLGVPPDCAKAAIQAISRAAQQGRGMGLKGQRARQIVAAVVGDPRAYEADPIWGEFARELLAESMPLTHEPISYRTWGT